MGGQGCGAMGGQGCGAWGGKLVVQMGGQGCGAMGGQGCGAMGGQGCGAGGGQGGEVRWEDRRVGRRGTWKERGGGGKGRREREKERGGRVGGERRDLRAVQEWKSRASSAGSSVWGTNKGTSRMACAVACGKGRWSWMVRAVACGKVMGPGWCAQLRAGKSWVLDGAHSCVRESQGFVDGARSCVRAGKSGVCGLCAQLRAGKSWVLDGARSCRWERQRFRWAGRERCGVGLAVHKEPLVGGEAVTRCVGWL
eukprot:138735-Chlamydomonas_euryale.AAC.1